MSLFRNLRGRSRSALTIGVVAALALATCGTAAAALVSSVSPTTAAPVTTAVAAAAIFNVDHQSPLVRRAVTKRFNGLQAYNWSGYAKSASKDGTFARVSAWWTVPAVTCPSYEHQATGVWVGIDGFNDQTIEQAGMDADCFRGQAYYYTWYEMFPGAGVEERQVQPGDSLNAIVGHRGATYTLSVIDHTSGRNFTAHRTCAVAICDDSSVEWIVERPAMATTGIMPLSDYSTVHLSAAAWDEFRSSSIVRGISMIDGTGTYHLSTVSPFYNNSFTATWLNSF